MAYIVEKTSFVDASGNGDEFRRTHHYQIRGTQSASAAWQIGANELGPVISTAEGTLFLSDVNVTSSAYNIFDVDVTYTRRKKEVGSWRWEMDGTGRSEHITHSLETISSFPTAAPDYQNAIGFDKGEISGTDVIRPSAKLSIIFTHPPGFMTIQYANYLSLLAGYVNSNPWLVWGAGEVRFLGPRCTDGSQTQSEAAYSFEIERTRTNFAIGNITGITKKGWHFAWVKSKLATATAGGATYATKVPQFVKIERVQEEIDFATAFGIS